MKKIAKVPYFFFMDTATPPYESGGFWRHGAIAYALKVVEVESVPMNSIRTAIWNMDVLITQRGMGHENRVRYAKSVSGIAYPT